MNGITIFKDAIIAFFLVFLGKQDATVVQLRSDLGVALQTIADRDATIAAKDAQIAELTGTLATDEAADQAALDTALAEIKARFEAALANPTPVTDEFIKEVQTAEGIPTPKLPPSATPTVDTNSVTPTEVTEAAVDAVVEAIVETIVDEMMEAE
jgi:hypothetical protein